MAVLALALVTAAVVASFSATSAEIVANNAMRAQDRAYQLAEAGLQQFLLRRSETGFCASCAIDAAVVDSEWTRVNLVGGYANVVATRVRPKLDDDPALFFIRSTGVDTMVKMSGAGLAVFATRTVGQYATFGTSGINALAAWTSLSGITNNGGGSKSLISGDDECDDAKIAGVTVPDGGQYSGGGPKPTGPPSVDSSMSLDALKPGVGIDWNAIINEAIPADVTIPGGSWPAQSKFDDPLYWPVIRVKSNYTIPNDGRGLIIADSNLTIPGNVDWEGIILVGGNLTASGTGEVEGAVVSGLNNLLPGAVNPPDGTSSDNDVISGTRKMQYDSCKAARAAERLRMYFAWSNTWLDNVAMW